MNSLILPSSSGATMTSVVLRDVINTARSEFGETKVRNDQLVSRIEDELCGELGVCKIIAHPQSGVEMRYYDLTIDQCMLVGMRESKGVRRNVLTKLKDLELKSQLNAIPQTKAELLRYAADLEEEKQAALAVIEQQKPAVEFVGRYVESTGNKGFRQVAKLLKAKEQELRQFLIDHKIMYKLGGEWSPYQTHIDAGRFVVKTGVADNEHAYNAAKFTPKGVNWLAEKWNSQEAA